ncbi:hypothetical protein CH275_14740 [Rhodococcus sp. 06-235-1A]|uniref:MarR family transcriptional regulator n=1 Tax=Rhodococcus sp. 06-235-1A TaxID=2022508 RepID=UPI000B9A60B1|nr:helix-turn-helix domain-containing protein [Rhodococcus sp. 06-235-1A]OZD04463.1 hypothetical protein CH275_14740 [Rhodococcus sp. 06-235-1A]
MGKLFIGMLGVIAEFESDLMRGPDPREALAANTLLTAAEIDEIGTVLKKLDARVCWAEPALYELAKQPGMTAAQLAEELPIDKDALKRRIRTLKEHGITRCLPSGYQLSPRRHRRAFTRTA